MFYVCNHFSFIFTTGEYMWYATDKNEIILFFLFIVTVFL